MTLEEAIKHCEEVAQDNECTMHSLTKDGWQEHFNNLTREKETEYKNVRDEMANSCLECAKEHRQLAEWLKELKRLREVLDKIRAEIMDFEEELFHRPNTDYADYAEVRHCVEIIDKYKAESEDKAGDEE